MNRRDMLASLGAIALVAGTGVASAHDKDKEKKADPHAGHAATGPHKNQALIDAADDCSKKGSLCINHCLSSFAAGDTTLAACAKTVMEAMAVCDALVTAAALESKNLPALAKAAIQFCKDCEDECRKHEKHHMTCKDCADACAKCLAECKKIAV
jgi:Cys-rich four helix bundle protein (predicted Tat secretion target)